LGAGPSKALCVATSGEEQAAAGQWVEGGQEESGFSRGVKCRESRAPCMATSDEEQAATGHWVEGAEWGRVGQSRADWAGGRNGGRARWAVLFMCLAALYSAGSAGSRHFPNV